MGGVELTEHAGVYEGARQLAECEVSGVKRVCGCIVQEYQFCTGEICHIEVVLRKTRASGVVVRESSTRVEDVRAVARREGRRPFGLDEDVYCGVVSPSAVLSSLVIQVLCG